MYPYLLPELFGKTIIVYDVLLLIGVFTMLFYVAHRLEKSDGYTRNDTNRILLLVIISLLFALLSSYLFDGIYHSIEEGEWSFGTITFMGGLIGGVVMFLLLFKYFYHGENKDLRTIMNTIITGVVIAHAIGRIGCFCAGCCFGIPTESFLGVIFPHGHAHITYGDTPLYPTQLFESFFLFVLFFTMINWKKLKGYELETYMLGYGIFRFLIEFIRGDDRGELIALFSTEYNTFPTPSQFSSLLLIVVAVVLIVRRKKQK